jgi:hypothetical protein
MSAPRWTPVGFVLLMLGFGLRLDTAWQGLAWLLLVAGTVCAAAGLGPATRRGAFVPPPAGR